MAMEQLARTLIHQLPLFFGLSPKQMKAFLTICKLNRRNAGETVCEYGASSNTLFILIEGQLDIVGADGTVVATTAPVTTVGEMGFIGRKPRSATVKTHDDCRFLTVEHHDFESLIESDPQLNVRIHRNMIRILSDKLSDANDMIVRYKKLYESSQSPTPENNGIETTATPSTVLEQEESAPENYAVPSDDSAAETIVRQFYSLTQSEFNSTQLPQDVQIFNELRKDGYSDVDIEYAVKWTARNIPQVKRFSMVKLSIAEAFEDKTDL